MGLQLLAQAMSPNRSLYNSHLKQIARTPLSGSVYLTSYFKYTYREKCHQNTKKPTSNQEKLTQMLLGKKYSDTQLSAHN